MPREHAHRANADTDKDKEPLRLIARSDDLFATVLTRLVPDRKAPETLAGTNGTVRSIVKDLSPHLFSKGRGRAVHAAAAFCVPETVYRSR